VGEHTYWFLEFVRIRDGGNAPGSEPSSMSLTCTMTRLLPMTLDTS